MSMRSTFLLLALLALLAVGVVDASRADAGLDLLPADAQGVLTVEKLSRFYTTFGILELREEYPSAFDFLTTEMIEDIGVDLLDPVALSAEGFDLERPFHVGVLTEPSAVVVLIPGEDRAIKWVRAKLEEQGVRFTREQESKGVTVEGDEADEVACFTREGYVGVVVTNHEDDGGPAMATAVDLIERGGKKTVAKSKDYLKVMAKLPDDADVRLFIGPELKSHMSNWGHSKEQLAERGMSRDDVDSWYREMGLEDMVSGVAVSLGDDRLSVKGYSWVGKDSPVHDWLRVDTDPVAFLRRAPSEPWLLALTRFNMAAFWRDMRPALERMRREAGENSLSEVLAEAREEIGIDLEADVINQVQGNVGLIVNTVSMMSQDLVVLVQVADPKRFETVVARLTEVAREDMAKKNKSLEEQGLPPSAQTQIIEDVIGGVKAYRISKPPALEACYGIIDDHFVVASTVVRFEKIAAGGAGVVESTGNELIRAGLVDPEGSVFYIDFRGLSEDAAGILPMFGPSGMTASQLLAELSELVATVKNDDEGMLQETTLTSVRPGIWKHIVKLMLERMDKVELD